MQATSASASALFDTYHTVDLYSIHSLHSPSLSPAQNREKYGIANSLHAHHYVVTVGFRGPVNATSHLLSELPDLAIVELLNRVHLNDIPWFQTRPTTAENLAQLIHRNLHIFRQTALAAHQIIEVVVEIKEGCARTVKDIGKPYRIVYRGEQ